MRAPGLRHLLRWRLSEPPPPSGPFARGGRKDRPGLPDHANYWLIVVCEDIGALDDFIGFIDRLLAMVILLASSERPLI